MTVSKNVIIFALIGTAVVSVDLYLSHQESAAPSHCNQYTEQNVKQYSEQYSEQYSIQNTAQDSVLSLTNLAAISSYSTVSDSLSESSLKQELVEVTAKQLSDASRCERQSDHSVSWMDWVFSWQDSPTFHYLDLLELLSSGDSHGNAGQTSPVKS
jgi:hypothetical protein